MCLNFFLLLLRCTSTLLHLVSQLRKKVNLITRNSSMNSLFCCANQMTLCTRERDIQFLFGHDLDFYSRAEGSSIKCFYTQDQIKTNMFADVQDSEGWKPNFEGLSEKILDLHEKINLFSWIRFILGRIYVFTPDWKRIRPKITCFFVRSQTGSGRFVVVCTEGLSVPVFEWTKTDPLSCARDLLTNIFTAKYQNTPTRVSISYFLFIDHNIKPCSFASQKPNRAWANVRQMFHVLKSLKQLNSNTVLMTGSKDTSQTEVPNVFLYKVEMLIFVIIFFFKNWHSITLKANKKKNYMKTSYTKLKISSKSWSHSN